MADVSTLTDEEISALADAGAVRVETVQVAARHDFPKMQFRVYTADEDTPVELQGLWIAATDGTLRAERRLEDLVGADRAKAFEATLKAVFLAVTKGTV